MDILSSIGVWLVTHTVDWFGVTGGYVVVIMVMFVHIFALGRKVGGVIGTEYNRRYRGSYTSKADRIRYYKSSCRTFFLICVAISYLLLAFLFNAYRDTDAIRIFAFIMLVSYMTAYRIGRVIGVHGTGAESMLYNDGCL